MQIQGKKKKDSSGNLVRLLVSVYQRTTKPYFICCDEEQHGTHWDRESKSDSSVVHQRALLN